MLRIQYAKSHNFYLPKKCPRCHRRNPNLSVIEGAADERTAAEKVRADTRSLRHEKRLDASTWGKAGIDSDFVPPPWLPGPHIPDAAPETHPPRRSAWRMPMLATGHGEYEVAWAFSANDEDAEAWDALQAVRSHTRRYDLFYAWATTLRSLYRLKVFSVLDHWPFPAPGDSGYARARQQLKATKHRDERGRVNEP